MTAMRVWIFDVEHGSAAFVRAPSGETLMVDCGRRADFSPARFIYQNELSAAEQSAAQRLSKFVVSHPHDDHIEDIDTFISLLPPRVLQRYKFYWPELQEGGADYPNLGNYASWQTAYNQPGADPDWGSLTVKTFSVGLDRARQLAGDFANNTSIVVVLALGTFKMILPGDLEKAGWTELLRRQDFLQAAAGPTVFVPSHHGHDSGYAPEIFQRLGRPVFNVISCHHGDESVCSAYATEQAASGITFGGVWRRSFTTRHDGSLLLTVQEDGSYVGNFYKLAANEPRLAVMLR